ncbi:MAG: DUF1963 domain-containing protein [Candidatus Obscuribacter sp.]|jgi:uncharacterized protein YwqG|nr:DUF1963 domain-containing protein [Candidatus Obscuribacter sp.]MBP6595367.1 DUF1963 domain-containing protein [Candidatus Obscuribacter sp.]MBP7575761.1 DUF1963 domain-containing protein [Candidatus Obscuribacter sp.]
MFSEGNSPEDATKLFNRALEELRSGRLDVAQHYLDLSLYYELRPLTYLERAKVRLLRQARPAMALQDVERGIELCTESEEHKLLKVELLNLRATQIDPLLAVEMNLAREESKRAKTIKGLSADGNFRELVEFLNLSEHYVNLKESLRPALRITLQKHRGKITGSKFGGIPDVPPDFIWPVLDGNGHTPLQFLCQLDLAKIHSCYPDSGLPAEGMLSFFADAGSFSFSYNPSAWKLFVFRDPATLVKANLPEELRGSRGCPQNTFTQCSVKFEKRALLPDRCSTRFEEFGLNEEQDQNYIELVAGWQGGDDGTFSHQLFGYPQLIQQDIFRDCKHQLAQFDPKYKKRFTISAQNTPHASDEWVLLLQIASDNQANFHWGDSGNLYFCIRKGDLAAGNFDGAMLVAQCF